VSARPLTLPADDPALAVSVWLRLLKAHALMLRAVRQSVPDGLTLPQFDVLAQLHRQAAMTPGQLTRELLVTAGNVTGIVERLVQRGLVERRAVPEDRRAVLLRLTPRGRQAMRRAIPRHRRDVESLLSAVPAHELARLRDALGALNRALEGPPR
jgi:DNA-binding MarR family transcriptional regulator